MTLSDKTINPIGDRVLIKELKSQDKKTSTGIIIPETASANDVKLGIVIAVGSGLYTQNGILIPMTVKKGDEVILPAYGTGQEVKIGKDKYTLYRESDLLAILN